MSELEIFLGPKLTPEIAWAWLSAMGWAAVLGIVSACVVLSVFAVACEYPALAALAVFGLLLALRSEMDP